MPPRKSNQSVFSQKPLQIRLADDRKVVKSNQTQLENYEQQIAKALSQSENTITMLMKFQSEIYAQIRTRCFDQIIKVVNDHIPLIKEKCLKLKRIIQNGRLNQNHIDMKCQELLELIDKIRQQLKEQLQFLGCIAYTEKLFGLLSERNDDCNRKFQYTKIQTIKPKFWNQKCFSFAFVKEVTLVFIGQAHGEIQIYGFNNHKKLIQTLTSHKSDVYCLICTKKSNTLISASRDCTIIIWNQNSQNSWKPYQILSDHTDQINCIIMNKDEDLLLSGSDDQQLIIWSKINQLWKNQQTINVQMKIFCMSLSQSQTKLIICGKTSNIFVFQQQLEKQWILIQTITVDDYGYQLCFINDDQFVFQPQMKAFLEIYNYDKDKNQFIQIKQIKVQKCLCRNLYFQCQFIEQKKILIVKRGCYVNCFGKDQYNNQVIQQSIKFGHDRLFGRLTDNGEFLLTWDYKSEIIQIRKLKYLE